MKQMFVVPWRIAPFLRILSAFIPGILVQQYLHVSFSVIISLLLLFVFTHVILLVKAKQYTKEKLFLNGIVIFMMIFFVGMMVVSLSKESNFKYWYAHHLTPSSILRVHVTEPPVEKNKTIQYKVRLLSVSNFKKPVSGNIILYIDKSVEQLPALGSVLLIRNHLKPFEGQSTPGAFDYGAYMQMKGYYHTAWLREKDFVFSKEKLPVASEWLYNCRDWILGVLSKHFKDPQILGVAEALLIGYKEHLDPELKNAYTRTGVVHVIAISGLHLGLIYVVLVFLIKRVRWIWNKVLLRSILILGGLWIFALLTGAPASVLRSAVMFSCMHIGEGFFRKSSVYNSMAASAFILLCYNPFFLWDPGFLLSYLAVLGIVALQRPLFKLIYFRWAPCRMIWGMVTVSLAAQLATLPVCILYFNQFPNYFLITNLLVVPLSTVILFAEIILVALSWCPCIEYWAWLTQWLIYLMNEFILEMSKLPFALTAPIFATVYSTWMLSACIVACCWGWLKRQNNAFFVACVFAVLFSCGYVFQTIQRIHHREVIVYNVPQRTSIDILYNNQFLYVGSEDVIPGNTNYEYQLKPSRIYFRSTESVHKISGVIIQKPVLSFAGKKWVWLDGNESQLILADSNKISVLLVSKQANVPPLDVLSALHPDVVVLDASNSMWKIEQWKKACEQLLLRCHSVTQNGPFRFNW